MSRQVWRRHAEQMLSRSGSYHDTLPQSEVVEVGIGTRQCTQLTCQTPQDIAVTISDATTPEQQQEPPGLDSGGSTADSQVVESPPAATPQ